MNQAFHLAPRNKLGSCLGNTAQHSAEQLSYSTAQYRVSIHALHPCFIYLSTRALMSCLSTNIIANSDAFIGHQFDTVVILHPCSRPIK